MNPRKDERRAEARASGRWNAERRVLSGQRIQATPQIGKHLYRHPCAHAAGIDELAVIGVVTEQQRSEMTPRAFRIRPTHDDELLAVERFRFSP